ncbi:MAG: Flp pilus assembly protein CpaB [Actinomycetota bacterium]
MNTTNRFWHVAAAAGLALLAVLLTTFYVTNYKRHVQHGEAQVTVLVAAKDIPADTAGAEIVSGKWLTEETVARRQVVPGAISNPDQVRGLVATQPTYAGEQVTARRFGTPSERGIRAQIQGTQRAVQVAGDANQVLAGTLRAGDHVDILGAWVLPDNGEIARVVIRDSLVLSAPTAPKGGSGAVGSPGVFAAQLRLSDAQSQKLEWILAHGKDWRFIERPSTNAANSPRWHETENTMLKDGAGEK